MFCRVDLMNYAQEYPTALGPDEVIRLMNKMETVKKQFEERITMEKRCGGKNEQETCTVQKGNWYSA